MVGALGCRRNADAMAAGLGCLSFGSPFGDRRRGVTAGGGELGDDQRVG